MRGPWTPRIARVMMIFFFPDVQHFILILHVNVPLEMLALVVIASHESLPQEQPPVQFHRWEYAKTVKLHALPP